MDELTSNMSRQLASKSVEEKAVALRGVISALSAPERAVIAKELASVLNPPTDKIRDMIWIIIIGAFALVLVWAAFVLGLGVFTQSQDVAKQVTRTDTILTVFTTVVGFLAGLLSPSPVGSKSGANS